MRRNGLISWFPKPINLTEISILSGYELIFYIGIFIFFGWLYFSMTNISVKSITIDTERIDSTKVNTILKIKKSPNHYESIAAISKNTIKITFPYSSSLPINYIDSMRSGIFENFYSTFEYVEIEPVDSITKGKNYNSLRKDSNRYDSLLAVYNNAYPSQIKPHTNPIYYQKITTSFNEYRLLLPKDGDFDTILTNKLQQENFVKRSVKSKKEGSESSITNEIFIPSSLNWVISETGGALSKPSIFDLCDISQCYLKFKIKSESIDTIYLDIRFDGANEFIFVKGIPTLVDCQRINYKLANNINSDIIIHVTSKELQNKQNARVFFITAVLSGLIVVFITFIIIFMYRLYSYRKKNNKDNEKDCEDSSDDYGKTESKEVEPDDLD